MKKISSVRPSLLRITRLNSLIIRRSMGMSSVLEARPLTKNKVLFRGRIWVDAKDFAIANVEGEPAVNPSWWTVKTDFKRSYQKVGSFWLPESNDSETKVRIFGTAVLTIKYGEYQITQTHHLNSALDMEEQPSNGQ